jgi:hypothetical protein
MEHRAERPDQTLRVGFETFVRHPNRIAVS